MSDGCKEIVLTGGGGLVGGYLSDLLQTDPSVRLTHVIRPGSGTSQREGLAEGRYVQIDLSKDWHSKDSLLPESPDTIVYLAQSNKYRNLPQGASHVFEVNSVSVARMAEYARQHGARQFIFASTGSVYQDSVESLSEDSPLLPISDMGIYPLSKLNGECLLREYADDFKVLILRLFFIYGRNSNSGMLIPRIFHSVRQGDAITLQGKEGMVLTPTFAGDVASLIGQAVETAAEGVFNFAGPETVSLKQLATVVGEKLGIEPRFAQAEAERMPPTFMLDLGKVNSRFEISPTPIRIGLDDCLSESKV